MGRSGNSNLRTETGTIAVQAVVSRFSAAARLPRACLDGPGGCDLAISKRERRFFWNTPAHSAAWPRFRLRGERWRDEAGAPPGFALAPLPSAHHEEALERVCARRRRRAGRRRFRSRRRNGRHGGGQERPFQNKIRRIAHSRAVPLELEGTRRRNRAGKLPVERQESETGGRGGGGSVAGGKGPGAPAAVSAKAGVDHGKEGARGTGAE